MPSRSAARCQGFCFASGAATGVVSAMNCWIAAAIAAASLGEAEPLPISMLIAVESTSCRRPNRSGSPSAGRSSFGWQASYGEAQITCEMYWMLPAVLFRTLTTQAVGVPDVGLGRLAWMTPFPTTCP